MQPNPTPITSNFALDDTLTLFGMRARTLSYVRSLKTGGRSVGYRHAHQSRKPTAYGLVSALLIKHLLNETDDAVEAELQALQSYQCADGLFRDPILQCPEAEGMYHGWGWMHLTLHALMVAALYGMKLRTPIVLAEPYQNRAQFRLFIRSLPWAAHAASVGNQLQNIGVLLQYMRDAQGNSDAGALLDVLYSEIDSQQNPITGLYGPRPRSKRERLTAVISAYHLWLLYFYDGRTIPHANPIIDNLLQTQNPLGGFGIRWNSSACEDIDSIDPLVRFHATSTYRSDEIHAVLARAVPALLRNYNPDGGFVNRRLESNLVIHREMYSGLDESDLFYTWFRTLTLAYLIEGLGSETPRELTDFRFNFVRAPGHQFPIARIKA